MANSRTVWQSVFRTIREISMMNDLTLYQRAAIQIVRNRALNLRSAAQREIAAVLEGEAARPWSFGRFHGGHAGWCPHRSSFSFRAPKPGRRERCRGAA